MKRLSPLHFWVIAFFMLMHDIKTSDLLLPSSFFTIFCKIVDSLYLCSCLFAHTRQVIDELLGCTPGHAPVGHLPFISLIQQLLFSKLDLRIARC